MDAQKNIIGWREWITLPNLGIPGVKAKIDTGAKTSCLHAFQVDIEQTPEGEVVTFKIHPLRRKKEIELTCSAPLVDRRVVRDSGGHEEERPVIETKVVIGSLQLVTEFTLTSRDDMLFPMLLGRRALQSGQIIVDANQSYIYGRANIHEYIELLKEK